MQHVARILTLGLAVTTLGLTACGGGKSPVDAPGEIKLTLSATADNDGTPLPHRVGMVFALSGSGGGISHVATVHELKVTSSSGTTITLSAREQSLPASYELNENMDNYTLGEGHMPSATGALVLLADEAPVGLVSEDEASDDEPRTTGVLVPGLTARQVEELGIVAILPVFAEATEETARNRFAFRNSDECDVYEDLECGEVLLQPGYHFARLDPQREIRVATYEACYAKIMEEALTNAGILGIPDELEMVREAETECGRHPGNIGNAVWMENEDEFRFEVGGPEDLLRGLTASEER